MALVCGRFNDMITNRLRGPYWKQYWALLLCNILIPQVLWLKAARKNVFLLFFVAMMVNTGMWLERFVIIVMSLHRDFLPSSWGTYWPTVWDFATFFGTFGLFLTFFMLFVRFVPMISISEMRLLLEEKEEERAVS